MECRFDDETSANTRWYIMDGLGSVLAEVDTQGRVNWDDVEEEETPLRKYDVYGFVRNTVADAKGNHKFVGSLGHASEADTGLIYMRARYYDAGIGRFISEDPAGDGTNWYAYCGNNPVNLLDPDGRDPVILAGEIIMGIGLVMCIWSPTAGGIIFAVGPGVAAVGAAITMRHSRTSLEDSQEKNFRRAPDADTRKELEDCYRKSQLGSPMFDRLIMCVAWYGLNEQYWCDAASS